MDSQRCANSLPDNKILHWTKLKVFAVDKLHVSRIFGFAIDMVDNIMRKGENAGYGRVFLFPKGC